MVCQWGLQIRGCGREGLASQQQQQRCSHLAEGSAWGRCTVLLPRPPTQLALLLFSFLVTGQSSRTRNEVKPIICSEISVPGPAVDQPEPLCTSMHPLGKKKSHDHPRFASSGHPLLGHCRCRCMITQVGDVPSHCQCTHFLNPTYQNPWHAYHLGEIAP